MALTVNGTAIPSSGKVICNGTSLDKVNCESTNVWQRGLNLLATKRWTITSQQDGRIQSSATYLKVIANARTDWWNWCVVRTSSALDLRGFTTITITWDNHGAGTGHTALNWQGWAGFSTNAGLTQRDWGNTNIEYVLHTNTHGASGTKAFSIPSKFRASGVYFYAQRNFYKANGSNTDITFTKIEIT